MAEWVVVMGVWGGGGGGAIGGTAGDGGGTVGGTAGDGGGGTNKASVTKFGVPRISKSPVKLLCVLKSSMNVVSTTAS